jgi:hypothetical protein
MKGLKQQEDTIINIYVPHKRSKYVKQQFTN